MIITKSNKNETSNDRNRKRNEKKNKNNKYLVIFFCSFLLLLETIQEAINCIPLFAHSFYLYILIQVLLFYFFLLFADFSFVLFTYSFFLFDFVFINFACFSTAHFVVTFPNRLYVVYSLSICLSVYLCVYLSLSSFLYLV